MTGLRGLLRRRGGRRGAARRGGIAAITVVRDEPEMLPRWVAHYGREVGLDHLLVVDDGSIDGSTSGLPCRVVENPGFPAGDFERARMRLVSELATDLLRTHEAVLFTDVDEFLIADPARHAGLAGLLAARPETDVLAGLALNVVHDIAHEPPLDPGGPVLGQRRLAAFVPTLCKPSIKRVDAPWRRASHGIAAPFRPDRELFLVHLKYADADLLRATADRRHAVHERSGLTDQSAWARTGDEMVAELASFMPEGFGGPADVPEFNPDAVDLDALVEQRGDTYLAVGRRQLHVMRQRHLVRVPDRLIGTV